MRLFLFLPSLLLTTVSSLPNDLVQQDDWKCKGNTLPGAMYNAYHELVTGSCGNLKDSLNQCCITFNDCDSKSGRMCVPDHEKCNAKVISGREEECSKIANKLIAQDRRFFPDNNWQCKPIKSRIGGHDYSYRAINGNPLCFAHKDRLSQCCADYNNCTESRDGLCVMKHEKCNSKVLSDSEKECLDAANKLINRDDYDYLPADFYNNWKCKVDNMAGSGEVAYRDLVGGSCVDLKDNLNQCCGTFKDCKTKSNSLHCVEDHITCNAKVVSDRKKECWAIANRLIQQEGHFLPSHDWKCKPPYKRLGGWEGDYYELITSPVCADFKGRLNECCINFNSCVDTREGLCIKKHEKCNSQVISGNEKECFNIANRFIDRHEHDYLPDDFYKNWKCKAKNMLGSGESSYRELVGGPCADLKDRLNQCCSNFDSCSSRKGTGCAAQHKACNSKVISGREKECSSIADRFIQEDQPDETSYRVVVYFQQVILYTKEQMQLQPFKTWIVITLIFISILFIICCCCCLCSVLLAKRLEKKDNHHGSSRASSVRSDSGKK